MAVPFADKNPMVKEIKGKPLSMGSQKLLIKGSALAGPVLADQTKIYEELAKTTPSLDD
jgi:hypothetical protein